MKIKKFNEGLSDKMKPKSEDEILTSLMNLTPYGMLDKILQSEIDDVPEYVDIAEKRIEMSIKELDNIFRSIEDEKLDELVTKVSKWVEINGGNPINITDYGLKTLSTHIITYGFQNKHDDIIIYDDEVFKSFRILLKDFAICEAHFNNRDVGS